MKFIKSIFGKSSIIPVIAVIIIINFREYQLFVLLSLLLLSYIYLYRAHNKRPLVKIFLFCAIMGPLMESIFILFGFWQYANEDIIIFNFAYYLPIVWGLAGVSIVAAFERFSSTDKLI